MNKKPYFTSLSHTKALVVGLGMTALLGIPHTASASFFSFLGIGSTNSADQNQTANSQTMALLEANTVLASETTGATISSDGTTIIPKITQSGDAESTQNDFAGGDQISLYIVHDGDTVKSIAKMFDVTESTIRWANDLSPSEKLTKDQVLTILPIDGVQYVIKKGDTLKSIAKKLNSDAGEIAQYNDLILTDNLTVGDTIIIPNGEISAPVVKPSKTNTSDNTSNPPAPGKPQKTNDRELSSIQGPYYPDYYIRPVNRPLTQGAHGKNKVAVDIGAPTGTPILAAASGKVIIAKTIGYNGGYANYVVIKHPNNTQTLYAHMSKVLVSAGDMVEQGQIIGKVGNTGNSTGPHLHFEVRGAVNPLTVNKNYGL